MMYLEQIGKDRQNRIRTLERHCKNLTARLQKSEQKIINQKNLINSIYEELEEGEIEEVWADVIDEGWGQNKD